MYIIKSTNIEVLQRIEPFETKLRTAEETASFCKSLQIANIGYIVLFQKENKWVNWLMEYNNRQHSFNNMFSIPEDFYKLLNGGLIPFDEDPIPEPEGDEQNE